MHLKDRIFIQSIHLLIVNVDLIMNKFPFNYQMFHYMTVTMISMILFHLEFLVLAEHTFLENFSNWEKTRVKILFEDYKNNSHHFYKYVDFDDIHLIRIDMYVYDPICLTKTNPKNLETVMNIQHDVNMKIFKREEYRREAIISLFKSQKIQKGLLYVAYAYAKYSTLLNKNDFFLHTNQIFTAYEACKFCLEDNKKKADKGFVYQIETGEGKSCIICLIAAVLALMKKNCSYYIFQYQFIKQRLL